MPELFLDAITQTPVDPRVKDAMVPYLSGIQGNPLSRHGAGERSRKALERARCQVAELMGASPGEIIFTATGTESNNLALMGLCHANRDAGNHVIISGLEHESVLFTARALQKEGFALTVLPVDSDGMTPVDSLKAAIRKETILSAVTVANGDVGTLQPIKEIGEICKENKIIFFADGVAAVGNIPVNVDALNLDALSLSGNQFYGPPGVAALYLRQGIYMDPVWHGGRHENHHRPGTHNLPGIVGLGKAAELAILEMPERSAHLQHLRDEVKNRLSATIPQLVWTGHPDKRLPNHLSFCVEGIEGEALLLLLEIEAGVLASSGSVCGEDTRQTSEILVKMGISPELARGAVRLTFLKDTRIEELDILFKKMPEMVTRLRKKNRNR
jgi:cysteine desulfurase